MDSEHQKAITELNELRLAIKKLSELARRHGILDIFQDNGAKILEQLIILNLKNLPGREGNDGIDEHGTEWEMKSANVELVSGFSTHHHLNLVILKKYRSVPWSFAFYRHSELEEIYVMTPAQLEPQYQKWQEKLEGKVDSNGNWIVKGVDSINNPKIPLKFVRTNGTKVYPVDGLPINPADIARKVLTE